MVKSSTICANSHKQVKKNYIGLLYYKKVDFYKQLQVAAAY